MKKNIIIISAIAVMGALFYSTRLQKIAHEKAVRAQDVAVYFNYAQEKIPQLKAEIEEAHKKDAHNTAKIEELKEELKTFTAVQIIARRDLHALQKATAEELQFKRGQIWVEGQRFNDTMQGKLASRILGGPNALAFVVFHSAMDITQADKDATLAMLKIVFEKKLDPHGEMGEVLWIKNTATDTNSYDYVALYSLPDAALMYSFFKAQKLIENYIQSFPQN